MPVDLVEYLNLKEDKLFSGIEDGLLDFDACLDALKVFCLKFNNVKLIVDW